MSNSYQSSPHQQMASLPPIQPPQRPYSPYQQSPGAMSPGAGIPPAKRQRLSPQPPSPYTTSPYSTSPYATSPTGQYLSPMPGTPAATMAPPLPFNQPQPIYHNNDMSARPQQSTIMGPPRMPYSRANENNAALEKNERSTDVNDLSDLVTAAGIDLRAEEEYLARNYRNQHGATSFVASFGSQTSTTVSPNNSFNQWSQGASQSGAFQGAGQFAQAVAPKSVEEDLNAKHAKAARALSEAQQYHLNDPFANPNRIRKYLSDRAYDNGIQINVDGLYDRIPPPQPANGQTMRGPDGSSITVAQADSILGRNAPLVDIITLISLAAQERLRGVVEDAYALSRSRQSGSQGVVPPQWADLADGNGNAQPTTAVQTNLTATAWEKVPDSAISPMTVPAVKREPGFENIGRLPTPPTETPPTPQPTIAFPNLVASALKQLAARDHDYEKERVAKRQKRLNTSQSASIPDSSAPGTPAPLIMPEKMTKKERDRLNKMSQTDDKLHQNTNATASMALGLGKSKKYSWMTGGSGGSGASTPSRINTSVGGVGGSSTPGSAPRAGGTDRALQAREKQFGIFKEDGPKGKNIQIRDLINVLELDGKERKTLMATLARLKSTET